MTQAGLRAYYDAFSESYDAGRGAGYHKLIDEQAAELVRRVGEGKRVLEVGCGTGLILGRVARIARDVIGVDPSPGMLGHARRRGLSVLLAEAGALPFEAGCFDVVCSFKVLAHVEDLRGCLDEMARVTRPGGAIVFDAYNPRSLRALIKQATAPRATSVQFDESDIVTRFRSVDEVKDALPPGTRLVRTAGIRVLTPHPLALEVPGVGPLLERLEWRLMDSSLARFAGFMVYQLEKLS